MLDRKIRKTIEYNFYNYEQNKKAYVASVDEVYSASPARLPRGNLPPDPTAAKAVKLAELEQKYLWCKVVENTLTAFRFDSLYKIINDKYFNKIAERDMTEDELWERYGQSRRTYYYNLEKILEYAYQWALQYNLIRQKSAK